MKIGFFDSGIGGVTVLREALRILPNADYLYYADTKNVPYGTKTREEARRCIFNAVDFIAGKGVDALVVACNTATSIAINDLRREYSFPIIGMEPAVKPAVEKSRDKRVLVFATPLTLKEEKFHNLVERVDSDHIVDSLPLPGLVDFAERFIFDREIVLQYLRDVLSPFDIQLYGTVVMGCTHFPFFNRFFKEIFPEDVDIIDGSLGTIRHLNRILSEIGLIDSNNENGEITYYTSGEANSNDRIIRYLNILV